MHKYLLPIIIIFAFYGAEAQECSFELLEFTVNGEEVTEFNMFVGKGKDRVKTRREGNRIFIPHSHCGKKQYAEIETKNIVLSFDNVVESFGYFDSDEIKADFRLSVEITLSELSNIADNRDKCTVFTLSSVPRKPLSPYLLVDPVTFRVKHKCQHSDSK